MPSSYSDQPRRTHAAQLTPCCTFAAQSGQDKYEGQDTEKGQERDFEDTIGYGHEVLEDESFSQGVTREQALQLLKRDAQKALTKVREAVTAPLKQHQLDALVSYVYNTGKIDGTKLSKKLNAGDFEGATREMDIVTQTDPQTGERKVLPGLVKRRSQEQKLFLEGDCGN